MIIFLVSILPATTAAVTVTDLYEAEVPIENAQPESREPAIKTALGMVLIKLTGNRNASGNPVLQPLLKKAESYMLEFKLNGDGLRLWVRFDEETLTKDLRGLGIAVWGKERPSTLLWLVINDETGRSILGRDGNSELLSVIDARSHMRGIDLTYPLLDLEDGARLRPVDIQAGFMQPILAASSRYPVDAILSGSVDPAGPDVWEGSWTGYINGESKTWQTEGVLPAMVIEEGIDEMADFLASKFIHNAALVQSNIALTVTGVSTVNQYAAVLKYLESLSSVTRVQVSYVTAGEITFMLQAHGGCPALSQAITLGRRLEPLDGNECSRYRLLP